MLKNGGSSKPTNSRTMISSTNENPEQLFLIRPGGKTFTDSNVLPHFLLLFAKNTPSP